MSDTERLGWFFAFIRLGELMGIGELSHDFDAMYAWYREASDASARFAPNKKRLVRDILGHVLACYPAEARGVMAAAFVAAMDDAYLTAAGLPRVPQRVEAALRELFGVAGRVSRERASEKPWLQSLLTSSVYPQGYEVSDLGAREPDPGDQLPSKREPRLIGKTELETRVARGELLVVLDGGVYDLSLFSELHPGGRAVLLRNAGKDATAAFDAAPHSAVTRALRENYCIGQLEGAAIVERGTGDVPCATVFGQRESRMLPAPEVADSPEELATHLVALVNARSAEPVSRDQIVEQLCELCSARSPAAT